MKKILLIGFALFSVSTALATELNYQWKAGSAFVYSTTVTDNISMSMMGLNMKDKYTTIADFVLLINSVDESGTASGHLYLMTYSVKNSKGISVASLNSLPKDAIKSEVTVDKKGNFTFANKLIFLTTPTSNVLTLETAQNQNASIGGSAGNHSVDAYAEFDPKTGKLKPGYFPQKLKNTKKVLVRENQESDRINVLPYDFLLALSMPEGDLIVGDHYNVTSGMYNIDILVNNLDNNLANIKQSISTNKSNDMFQTQMSGQSGDESSEINFNTQSPNTSNSTGNSVENPMGNMGNLMGGIGSMGMPSEKQMNLSNDDKKALEISKSMMPTMNGKVETTFDYVTGAFKTVKGTLTNEINAMGVKMTVNSAISMTGR